MGLKYNRLISVAVSPTLVKVAVVKASGAVEKVVRQAVDKDSAAGVLKQIVSPFLSKGTGLLCVIPGDVVTTKNLEVPSVDTDEIESILSLQAVRHTPLGKDEILTSYVKIGSPKPNFTRVLLLIVKRQIVKEKLDIFKAAGLDVSSVVFVPEGIARFYARAINLNKSDAPAVIIDVAPQGTTFIVTAYNTILMSRNIPVGLDSLSGNAGARDQLVNDIKASIEAYDQEGLGPKIAVCYLTSENGLLAGIDEMIVSALGVKACVLSYVEKVVSDKAVKNILAADFGNDTALDVIATACAFSKCEADLVPQEIRDQRAIAEKGREFFRAGVLIVCILFFVGAALISKVYFKDAFFKVNLIAKYADQQKAVHDLERMASRTKVVRQFLATRNLSLDAVRELYSLIPPEIYLSGIDFNDAGDISLQGVSETMSQVFSFVTALENSDLFEGVKTKSTAARKERGKDMASFEIVMKLTPDYAGSAGTTGPEVNKTPLEAE